MIRGKVGVRVVSNDFPRLAGEVRRRAGEYVAKAAHDIEAHTKRNIQGHGLVDTGNLMNSVRAVKVDALRWQVVVGADYGIYHELGTRFLPARPFLLPAATLVAPSYHDAMRQLLAGVK